MAKNLVIVESPAKAKTISRFLGKDYKVLASMGHVRDLPKSKMGIDTEGSFEPTYEVSPDKKKVITELKKEMKAAEVLWLATDEDREGEAIGWHLLSALKVPKKMEVKRIVFHEITEKAIKHSVEEPREINQHVVDAQQARRILDRLVGYELSPFLWKKVKPGLSAGRVQSVAVRMIVERERAIEAFEPVEYWKILADLQKKDTKEGGDFIAELKKFEGEKIEVVNAKGAEEVQKAVDGADFKVLSVEKKQTKRNPAAPFITSTLQQEAARKLGFSVKKTMMVAQRLYEGIDTGEGHTGLITYMRTDSVNLSNLALTDAKKVIEKHYGKEFALDTPRKFKGKKGAQEAHEAIRPVDLHLRPDDVAKYLDKDQLRVYELIWKRTLACQMKEALLNKVGVDISAEKGGVATGYQFRATGQTIAFPGFMEVYLEGRDEDEEQHEGEKFLPELSEGEVVNFKDLQLNQHFTKPPARYTEASLVKKLESEGIGRPSTYAPTISTIINRGYIEKEAKSLRPTSLAMVVTDLLVAHFSQIVDYQFTADMEDKLDLISEGKTEWVPVIKQFYGPFHKNLEEKSESLTREDVMKERDIGKDPKSGLMVVGRMGRFGPYVQIGKYSKEEIDEMTEKPRRASLPKDTYLESITLEESLKALSLPRELGKNKDGELVIVTTGRFGPYLKVGDKNVSLPQEYDPHEVVLADAEKIAVLDAEIKKKMKEPIAELGKDPESGGDIVVKVGRFGPYVTDGKTNCSIKKSIEPTDVTFEIAVEMLIAKRKRGPGRRGGKKKK
jgi:DNA topoisomerase I